MLLLAFIQRLWMVHINIVTLALLPSAENDLILLLWRHMRLLGISIQNSLRPSRLLIALRTPTVVSWVAELVLGEATDACEQVGVLSGTRMKHYQGKQVLARLLGGPT